MIDFVIVGKNGERIKFDEVFKFEIIKNKWKDRILKLHYVDSGERINQEIHFDSMKSIEAKIFNFDFYLEL